MIVNGVGGVAMIAVICACPWASAIWANFLGALAVAAGGVVGSIEAHGGDEPTRKWSWFLVMAGGAAIAGASFQATGVWT